MATKRTSKRITNQAEIDYLLSLTEKDITLSNIFDMFGTFNGKQRMQQWDTFTVPKGSYGPDGKKNKNSFVTTAGIWIFNKYMIEESLFDLFKYKNQTITKKDVKKMSNQLVMAVQEDMYTVKDLDIFLQKTQKLMPLTTALTSSNSEQLLCVGDYINPKKEALFKKYQKELESGDVIVAEKVEKELINDLVEHLGDDPSLDIYKSGARSDYHNHLKTMYVMKGAVTNPDPKADQKFLIMKSNYNDGVSKEEYPIMCKSLATGPYSRSKKTEIGGYWEKLIVMAYQDVVIGKEGSDCGTKDLLTVTLDDDNIDGWMYSYIKTSSGLEELTSKNRDKYKGKTVQVRFAGFCEAKNCICHRCAGNSFNRLNVENIGVAMGMIGSIIKNIAMKAFHDGTVSTMEIDPKIAFGE